MPYDRLNSYGSDAPEKNQAFGLRFKQLLSDLCWKRDAI
jgi:hypothetical protein